VGGCHIVRENGKRKYRLCLTLKEAKISNCFFVIPRDVWSQNTSVRQQHHFHACVAPEYSRLSLALQRAQFAKLFTI
jgi:hypothetical protein